MSNVPQGAALLDAIKGTDAITDYDRACLPIYFALIDAAAAGTDWETATRDFLGIDPVIDPERGRNVHDAHLERARWLISMGFRLLSGDPPKRKS